MRVEDCWVPHPTVFRCGFVVTPHGPPKVLP